MMKIFTLLSGLSVVTQTIVFVGLTLVFIILVAVLLKRTMSYEGKFGRLRLGRQDPSMAPYSPHRTCPHVKDVVILLDSSVRISQRKYEITMVETIKLQMAYVEQRIDEGISSAQSMYLSILKEQQEGNEHPLIVSNPSYLGYRIVLKAVKEEVLSRFRVAFRENHLAEMDEVAFSRYTERMLTAIINRCTEILNDLYFFTNEITREELYNRNQKLVIKMRELNADVFTYARNAAVEASLKVMRLDEDHTALLAQYL